MVMHFDRHKIPLYIKIFKWWLARGGGGGKIYRDVQISDSNKEVCPVYRRLQGASSGDPSI
jgi:hypothetical protein